MKDTRRITVLSAIVTASLVLACGPQRVRTPDRPGQTLIVLLPDSDSTLGRTTVSNPSGTAHLEAARDSTLVSAAEPPAPVAVLSQSEVQRIFRDTLDALPPPPQRFTLHFRFESDELTEESRAMVPEILKTIKGRPVPDLVIVGHTDTTGMPAANFHLGRTRALMVRGLLVEAGLDAAVVEIASHGESEPQVQTADETLEPRNRRVEISVR